MAVLPALAVSALAAEPAPDKSQYNLPNPAPLQWLREMSTDRPDKTESPMTADAGYFQVEMDLVTYSYDKHNTARDGTIVGTWSVAPANLKVGPLNKVDLQLVVQPHTYVHTSDPAAGVWKQRGFGDLLTRVKWNLRGNEGGTTAFGLMPYVKWPVNQNQLGNHSVEGGLILPLAVELPAGWSMGLMTQLDVVRDTTSSGYHPEFFSSVSAERGSSWAGTVDLGLTYALTKNVQLHAGINLGVTRAADDIAPFVGLPSAFETCENT